MKILFKFSKKFANQLCRKINENLQNFAKFQIKFFQFDYFAEILPKIGNYPTGPPRRRPPPPPAARSARARAAPRRRGARPPARPPQARPGPRGGAVQNWQILQIFANF